jgi:type II secretory pathway pseudopilin PulG
MGKTMTAPAPLPEEPLMLRNGEYFLAAPVQKYIDALRARLQEAESRAAALQKELEAARKDAERYRWLRDDAANQSDSWAIGVYPADERCIVTGAELDAAIDAALSKESK